MIPADFACNSNLVYIVTLTGVIPEQLNCHFSLMLNPKELNIRPSILIDSGANPCLKGTAIVRISTLLKKTYYLSWLIINYHIERGSNCPQIGNAYPRLTQIYKWLTFWNWFQKPIYWIIRYKYKRIQLDNDFKWWFEQLFNRGVLSEYWIMLFYFSLLI